MLLPFYNSLKKSALNYYNRSDPIANTSAPICLYYIIYGKGERHFTGKTKIDSNRMADSCASNHFNYQAVNY